MLTRLGLSFQVWCPRRSWIPRPGTLNSGCLNGVGNFHQGGHGYSQKGVHPDRWKPVIQDGDVFFSPIPKMGERIFRFSHKFNYRGYKKRGGGVTYSLFSPRSLGIFDPIWRGILFQMGWLNHQLILYTSQIVNRRNSEPNWISSQSLGSSCYQPRFLCRTCNGQLNKLCRNCSNTLPKFKNENKLLIMKVGRIYLNTFSDGLLPRFPRFQLRYGGIFGPA